MKIFTTFCVTLVGGLLEPYLLMGTAGQKEQALKGQGGECWLWTHVGRRERWFCIYPLPFSVLNLDEDGVSTILGVKAESESWFHLLQGTWELNLGSPLICTWGDLAWMGDPGHIFHLANRRWNGSLGFICQLRCSFLLETYFPVSGQTGDHFSPTSCPSSCSISIA